MKIARARPDCQIERRDGFQIVIEYVGLSLDNNFQRAVLAQKIRREHLNCRLWAACTDSADGVGKMLRPTVGEVIAIDRRDDDVSEAELGSRLGDMSTASPVIFGMKSGLQPCIGCGLNAALGLEGDPSGLRACVEPLESIGASLGSQTMIFVSGRSFASTRATPFSVPPVPNPVTQ